MDAAVSFHESTVIDLRQHQDAVELVLTDVSAEGRKFDAIIWVGGVRSILADDQATDDLRMLYPDGEVLRLDLSPTQLDLLIEWNDFAGRRSIVRQYRITGKQTSVSFPRRLKPGDH